MRRNNEVRADRRAIEARRASAEGRAPRRMPAEPAWSWITEKAEVEQACLNILRGVPQLYPIFGIQLYVEERSAHDGKFAALVYHDAKLGDEGQNLCGELSMGFWIGVKELLGNPAKKTFKTSKHELFVLTLLAQPEMQVALNLFKQEEQAARAKALEHRNELLMNLRSKVLGTPRQPSDGHVLAETRKPGMPELTSIGDILTCETGVIQHGDITIAVERGPQDRTVVRIKAAPEGHPMHHMMTMNIFARRDALFYSGDNDNGVGGELSAKAQLAVALRSFLRAQLISAGHTLLPPSTGKSHPNGNGASIEMGSAIAGKDRGAEVCSVS